MTKIERDKPQTTKKAKARIPSFRTIEQEAEFWDSHSLSDFADQADEVTDIRFVRPQPKRGMTLRLEPETLATLSGIARAQGIGPSTLARMWILERLRESSPPPPRRGARSKEGR